MSIDQLPPARRRPSKRDAQLVRYDEYINKQIESTRRMVKVVDVMTALVVIAAGTIGFLLAAAVVEHWLVPGGFSPLVRAALFAALAGGVGYYAYRRLGPLCLRSISPAYAAKTIEEDNPSLKNSLLNLLLFRDHRAEITDAVYETLEEQAAQRLTRVPVEAAVDRTSLLRLGYVLMAIVAVAALYKVLSPKDPLVTAQRVLMPWSDMAPASRVSISNVEPGTVTIARGEVLTISADVRGIGPDDPVVVRYTTADNQALDKPAPMKPATAGFRFSGQIPPADQTAHGGVAQNLRYRIEAGDARSREYSVTVVAAPTIAVERIDYDYPEYTGFSDRSVERLGDISAIEGTRVTIYAVANQPIEEASVDFEADGRQDIVLNVDGSRGQTSFVLALRDDRQTPKFTSYALRFTGEGGRRNSDPVKYAIDVLPDDMPEVSIQAPREKTRDVRLNETVAIEVDAIDPDFALAEVRLKGEVASKPALDVPLLEGTHTGRFTGRVKFTPNEHDLKPGDVLRYWATARDHRTATINEATSDVQMLRIVAPDPSRPEQPPPDRLAQREPRESQGNEGQQQGQQQGEQPSGESGQAAGESASGQGESEQGGESSADGEAGDSGENQEPGESDSANGQSGSGGEQGSSQQSGEQQGESQSGESPSGESQSGREQPGEGPSSTRNQGESTGDAQQPSGQNGGRQPTGQQQKSPSDANGEDASPREGGRDQQRSGNPQGGNGRSGQSEPQQQSPVSPEGDNDGEAFDRIQKFLQREGKLPDKSGQQPEDAASRELDSPDGQTGESPSRDQPPTGDDGQRADEQADASDAHEPGAETRPGDRPETTQEPPGQESSSRSPSGEQTSTKGESGAGEQPEQNQGAPNSQPNTKPTDKRQQAPSGDRQNDDQEPPAGGRGKQESNSQGEQGGDRTGGGEEGGGQKAPREGTGSAGQNQSADEGAGQSSEQGAGRDSSSAGQDAKADERTGQSSSDEQGAGSEKRDAAGEQPGGAQQDGEQQGEKSGAEDGPARSEQEEFAASGGEQSENGKQNSERGSNSGGQQPGAGEPPSGPMQPARSTGTAPEADAANLEYARRETDLVLETLDEHLKRKQVDRRLLDELGWSEADLKRFLDRWQQLKAAARDDGPEAETAQRELDDALRSLGLGRGPLQQRDAKGDKLRDLRQGYRGNVPLEYKERLRAYSQGVSRARQSDE